MSPNDGLLKLQPYQQTLAPAVFTLNVGVFLKRSMAMLLGSIMLAGSVSLAAAQGGHPTAAEEISNYGNASPRHQLLPDALDGWVQTAPAKPFDPAQRRHWLSPRLSGIVFVSPQQSLHTRGRYAQRRARADTRVSTLRRLLLLSAERLAQGRHRNRSHFKPQPRALLEGHHRCGCQLLSHLRPGRQRGYRRDCGITLPYPQAPK